MKSFADRVYCDGVRVRNHARDAEYELLKHHAP